MEIVRSARCFADPDLPRPDPAFEERIGLRGASVQNSNCWEVEMTREITPPNTDKGKRLSLVVLLL